MCNGTAAYILSFNMTHGGYIYEVPAVHSGPRNLYIERTQPNSIYGQSMGVLIPV